MQIALIATCLVYLMTNGMTSIKDVFFNTGESSDNNLDLRDEKNMTSPKLKSDNVFNETYPNSAHIFEYLEKIMQDSEHLITKDCQKWNAVKTSSHKYVLPINAKKSESADSSSNEEGDHRMKSFKKIFDTNAWGQSKSGPGSLISATERIRAVLNAVIEETKKYLKKDKIRFKKC